MNKKGISLIVLVITIVIMIILAGAVILTLVNSGIIGQTKIGIFKNDVSSYKSELQAYLSNELLTDTSFKADEFSRDKALIKTYITSMSDINVERFLIVQGELKYINEDGLFTTEEIAALRDIGVAPSEYNWAEKINNMFYENTDYTGNIYINPRPTETNDELYLEFDLSPLYDFHISVDAGVKHVGVSKDEHERNVLFLER